MLKIIRAETTDHYEQARKLFTEYVDSLGFDLEFQGFSEELASLPGAYSSPTGCLLLAIDSGSFVGCVGLRKIDEITGEMKRLYVIPDYRGKKIGQILARDAIDEARRLAYKRIRLDTLASMKEANALYMSLGFRQIEPYYNNPLKHVIYYELILL